jgi:Cysteine rich repeat
MKKQLCTVSLVVALLLPAGLAFADTQEPQNHPRPCQEDAQKFCPQVTPEGGNIVRCLKEHEQELSGACKAALKGFVRGRARHQPAAPAPEPGQRPALEYETPDVCPL